MDILNKIKRAKLVGRGGASFPTSHKWEFVKKSKGYPKYVICNASEGELGIMKDYYILKNHLSRVFFGLSIAMDFLETCYGYFNMNGNYYKKLKKNIDSLIKEYENKGYEIKIFEEIPSYCGGEETALLNAIEGKRIEPRLKPPYPANSGLFGKPTLVHNVETLFNIADVFDSKFKAKRFYCITGEIKNPGIYHYPANWTIIKVLKETNNVPDFDYFVQIGGSASGMIFDQNKLNDNKVSGAGSIEVYKKSISSRDILLRWFDFYSRESCGKCTPCREGTYQLYQLIKNSKQKIQWDKIMEIIDVLENTAFCPLGKSLAVPVRSYRSMINE